jgi:hypothetical protein
VPLADDDGILHPRRDLTCTAMPLPPAAVTSAAASWIVPGREESPGFSDRPVTYTVEPCLPSATAIPRPAPRLAPVTTAIVFLFGISTSPRYCAARSEINEESIPM